jgi:hypothetical protein
VCIRLTSQRLHIATRYRTIQGLLLSASQHAISIVKCQ